MKNELVNSKIIFPDWLLIVFALPGVIFATCVIIFNLFPVASAVDLVVLYILAAAVSVGVMTVTTNFFLKIRLMLCGGMSFGRSLWLMLSPVLGWVIAGIIYVAFKDTLVTLISAALVIGVFVYSGYQIYSERKKINSLSVINRAGTELTGVEK